MKDFIEEQEAPPNQPSTQIIKDFKLVILITIIMKYYQKIIQVLT